MAERLFQVGIKAVITNENGEILLLSASVPNSSDQRWDLPGGRMDENETFLQTLDRELHEEIDNGYLGEPVFIKSVLSKATIPVGDTHVGLVLIIYRVQIAEDAIITLNDYETAFDWFAPEAAAKHLERKYPEEFTELVAKLK